MGMEERRGGEDVNFDLDTRGWAMRHGHSKALLRRRKAGAPCVFCGRNSFSRTVNVSRRWHQRHDEFSRARKKREARQEVVDVIGLIKQEFCDQRANLEEVNFECVTQSSAWRWEDAIARAADAMQICTQTSSNAARGPPTRKQIRLQEMERLADERKFWQKQREQAWASWRESRCSRKQLDMRPVNSSVQQRLDAHQSLVKNGADVSELERSTRKVFDSFLTKFLQQHRGRILSSLADIYPRSSNIELRPADISTGVQIRFLKAIVQLGGVSASLRPVFHGTKPGNIPSIFARGLLIPGMGNEIRVANGSAHGLGIYTANLSHARLSNGFGGRRGMLVCGVLDDAVELPAPRALGCFRVTAESAAVRHVGGAVVVFDARRVVPLLHVNLPKLKRFGRPDLCCQKENKKKHRTAAIAQRHLQNTLVPAVAARRPARRRRMCRGLNRSGVGAFGLASHL